MYSQVPFRRVHLTDGTSFDKYDTTGPQVRFASCCHVVKQPADLDRYHSPKLRLCARQ